MTGDVALQEPHLVVLGRLLLVDGAVLAERAVRLLHLGVILVLLLGTVDALLEDGLGFVDIKLGLDLAHVVGHATAVGSAPSVGEVEVLIGDFIAGATPVAFAATVLLGLLGIGIREAMFGEVLGDVVLRSSCAVSKGSVVSVVGLVGASHVGLMERRRVVVSLIGWLFVC